MLQKILVILIGLVMSLVGAFAPSTSLFASHPAPELGLAATTAHDETLTTVHTADGSAFAKVSVLWVEVDGRRISEDAWGTGDVKELRFKVGTKDVDNLALAVGDKLIAVHPTDVMTVRMFHGEFSYRGLGTPLAAIALQGTVKTTLVSEGGIRDRVQTQTGVLPRAAEPAPKDGSVAYVVLDTGKRLDTVSVTPTAQRFFTEEASAPNMSASTPGNLLARFVKINGKLVKDYTSGDGSIDSIEFQPALGQTRSGVVAFNGAPAAVDADARVVVKDFVGEYLVYQVSDGLVRLRLDGYASDYATGGSASAALTPTPLVGGMPNAAFDFSPANPTTSDTITFNDRSADDGYIVFRLWSFGDSQTQVTKDPTHRFALPGLYEVTLNVTDNDLNQREVTLPITVRNSDPMPSFEFAPKIVESSTLVAFTDRSTDLDGTIENFTWDFGDGAHAFVEHPAHAFHGAGNYTVTLTTRDNLGGQMSISKVVIVRNAPPLANFRYAPSDPLTLVPVQFVDASTDRDGTIVSWDWSFGDGTTGLGSAPTHTYLRPGVFTVVLSAVDNNGGVNTVSQNVVIQNRAPIPSFTWSPNGGPIDVPVIFTSTSTDPDSPVGVILLTTWNFGDGSPMAFGSAAGGTITHTFARHGIYNVTMTVTDGLAQSSLTRSVAVADSAPRASISITPNPAYRGTNVLFADISTDIDGDPITSRFWTFGDGNTSSITFPNHTYYALGDYPITLQVRDSENMTGYSSTVMHVINRPPSGNIQFSPTLPVAGQPVTFTGLGIDPDDPFNGSAPMTYAWTFSDSTATFAGQTLQHTFPTGDYTVILLITDAEGGVSSPINAHFHVDFARPNPSFTFTPTLPNEGAPVTFLDASTTPNPGGIRSWRWTFGDTTASPETNPVHTFAGPGTYVVTLSVIDAAGKDNATSQNITVNGRPTAAFSGAPALPVPTGTFVQLTDLSSDPESEPLTYAWNFGDGSTSTLANPSHTFSRPGDNEVVLVVTDPHGANGTARRVVHVVDSAPTAGFTYSTPGNVPPTAGQPINFEATGSSHDPDGDATIVSWSWDFGDGAKATTHNPSHTYANSGIFTVSLKVADTGNLSSAPISKRIRVGTDHPVTLRISANLPGNRVAELNDSHYRLAVTFHPTGSNPITSAKSDLTAVGSSYDFSLAAGDWVAGDSVTVSLSDDRWMRTDAPLVKGVFLSDSDGRHGNLGVSFDLSMPLIPTLSADPGTGYFNVSGTGVSAFPNNTQTANGEPIYRSVTERFHGSGTVFYIDGVPATGATVHIEARWLPLSLVAGARDTPSSSNPLLLNNFVTGWCRVGDPAPVDVVGNYTWSFQGGDCLSSSLLPLFPVGVWEVRATAVYSFATTGTTAHNQRILVDPTGGIIATLDGLPP